MKPVGKFGEDAIVCHFIDKVPATNKDSRIGHLKIKLEDRSICVHKLPVGAHGEDRIEVWRMAEQAKIVGVWWCGYIDQPGMINIFFLVHPLTKFVRVSWTPHNFCGSHD